MHTTFNSWLVALSVAVAVFVSYTAFRLAARVTDEIRPLRRFWTFGGACVLGIGIWSMHFIGMLAMSMSIQLHYNVAVTLLSLLVAILTSWGAIRIAAVGRLSVRRLGFGALVMGGGIAAMHYLGMAAIDITPAIHYRPVWVGASILFGILASGLALGLTFRLRGNHSAHPLSRLGGAVLMGLGISGTHYLGMAAAHFVPGAASRGGLVLDSFWCAATIALAAGGVLACTLISDLYTTELAARARAHAGRLRQINAQLRHQALHDALTGLPNRTAFLERLGTALMDARTGLGPFAVLALDLDRFKLINDSLGHSVGDELLREVARRLRTAVRSGDTVARMSGDEFLVLARQVRSRAEAGQIAESIIEALSKPLRLDSLEVLVSTSIGISLHPGDADAQETLLAHADEAMYSAKRRGGRTWQCFAADMNGFTQERLRLESDLHRALERGQLELHYQPRVDVVSGRVSSVEALLRWRHPERGYIPPLAFIPIAEETGLILPIGAWVLQEACRQARRWQNDGLPLRVAVNLSALQFRESGLLHTIATALDAQQLPPMLLELEITESAVMTDAQSSVAILEQLSRMGVVVSVDDFGTGYSNMSYLRRFPIDRLKIDASFVREMNDDPQTGVIVHAIISLAHSLHMKVIAEGVETPLQLARLAALGCDQYQGYLFGRPASAASLESKLRAHAGLGVGESAATSTRLRRPTWGGMLLASNDD